MKGARRMETSPDQPFAGGLVPLCARHGKSGLGLSLLPVNETANDHSPYDGAEGAGAVKIGLTVDGWVWRTMLRESQETGPG